MNIEDFNWEPTPISTDDQVLIDEYLKEGIALDALVYTDDFRRLVDRLVGHKPKEADLRRVYLRLLGLRKRGLLPRIYSSSALANSH